MTQQLARTDDSANEVVDLSGGLLGVIARAARDPAVDIDKMERLLEMQERVIAREARTAFAVALADLQPLLPVITERGKILNKTGGTQSTYAYWEDVNEQIRPLLSTAGFSLSFRTGRAGSDITVTGVLSHKAGHSEETTITLPSDASGNKNAVQAVASSTSYGKRYTAFALLNITTKGEDDDGQAAGAEEEIDEAQLVCLQQIASAVGADLKRFCSYFKVQSLASIPARRFEEARKALQAKAKKEGAA